MSNINNNIQYSREMVEKLSNGIRATHTTTLTHTKQNRVGSITV